jgi:UDP:flavonoid glycosyltransferase YjiC (YdhE family)
VPVWLETAERWRSTVDDVAVEFVAAPEFAVLPSDGSPLSLYEAVEAGVASTRSAIRQATPDIVVHDILTLAPALSAELEGVPVATMIPHVSPVTAPGAPPYGLGAKPPRTPFGRALMAALQKPINKGLDLGLREYNDLRGRLSLPPRFGHHAALSPELILVGTFPQLEHSLSHDPRFHVTGPLFWEPDFSEVELPAGSGPLVLVAPSTAQDPDHHLLRASLEGLGSIDCRVLATWNRRPLVNPPPIPANTSFVEWLSYSKTMPRVDCVISHGGHGTVARTLQAGAVPVVAAFAGDQFENAARVDTANLGVRVPKRLISPWAIKLAVEKALTTPAFRTNCELISDWSRDHSGAANAADLVLSA